jgi:hypothetical protein
MFQFKRLRGETDLPNSPKQTGGRQTRVTRYRFLQTHQKDT